MGCVQVTYLRLTNSDFETCLMVLSQKIYSKVLRNSRLVKIFWWGKNKMATEIVQNLDYFLWNESWYTSIQIPRFCKCHWILKWSKWILLIAIPTQVLLTIMGSTVDRSSRCKLNVYIIAHIKEKPCTANWFFSRNLVIEEGQKSEKKTD